MSSSLDVDFTHFSLLSSGRVRQRERARERENSRPRCCFVTLGTVLDSPELVMLSGENRCFPVRAEASASHTRSPLRNPLQGGQRQDGERRRDEGRRGGKVLLSWPPTRSRPRPCSLKRVSNKVQRKHAGWKNTTICFSLLRNLLSCFPPPPTPPTPALQLQLKHTEEDRFTDAHLRG